MKKWEEDFITLAESITDEDASFRRHLIMTGTDNEENARILTDFIHENHIDCHNCWTDMSVYPKYEKLFDKVLELDPNE